jgi:hypothetical protein
MKQEIFNWQRWKTVDGNIIETTLTDFLQNLLDKCYIIDHIIETSYNNRILVNNEHNETTLLIHAVLIAHKEII